VKKSISDVLASLFRLFSPSEEENDEGGRKDGGQEEKYRG
jgi:hypothetical protein